MPQQPPPPIAKPGRVRVFQAVETYVPNNNSEDNVLAVQDGSLLYITERLNDENFFDAKCDGKIGKIPRSYINNKDSVISIDFPLHDAARRGNVDLLMECLNNEVSINLLDKSGSTALYWAAHSGHTHIVQLLLSKPNISVTSQNKLGDTPLHVAAYKNRLDCVHLLIEAGADPHTRNRAMQKPIDMTTNPEVAAALRLTMNNCVDYATLDEYADKSSDEEIPEEQDAV